MLEFKKNGVYDFDTIYANCKYAIHDIENCNCNNGYICGHKDCTEACECNEELGKCYTWSCPLVISSPSREDIELGIGNYTKDDIKDIDFDDEDICCDHMELVIWIGEKTNLKSQITNHFALTGEVEELEIEDTLDGKGTGRWKKLVSSTEQHLLFFISGTETNEEYTEGGIELENIQCGMHFVSESDFEASLRDIDVLDGIFSGIEPEEFYEFYKDTIKTSK